MIIISPKDGVRMQTVLTGDGRKVPLIIKTVESKNQHLAITDFKIGDKVKVYQPYGGYGGTPEFKIGNVKDIKMARTGGHKFTSEGCEVYEALCLIVDIDYNEHGYFEGYPYPIRMA